MLIANNDFPTTINQTYGGDSYTTPLKGGDEACDDLSRVGEDYLTPYHERQFPYWESYWQLKKF